MALTTTKPVSSIVAALLGTMFVAAGIADWALSAPADKAAKTATVTGTVTVDESCTVRNALVYIPGQSFFVKLGDDGGFTFYNVPVATGYTLRIEVQDTLTGAWDSSLDVNVPNVNLGVLNVPGFCGTPGEYFCETTSCEDNNLCTSDTCDSTLAACVFTTNVFYPNAACDPATGGLGVCNALFGNCDNNDANGCEALLTDDPSNCGVCGNVCAGNQACTNGQCVTITCTADDQCQTSEYCSLLTSTCTAKKANGAACGLPNECLSGICKGGFCSATMN